MWAFDCERRPLSVSAEVSGFAHPGDSLFPVAPCPAGKKVSKNACPCIRPCASLRVRSLHHCSEGRRTRAVYGPLSLSPHPCGSLLYTTTALTLLKGRVVAWGCGVVSVGGYSPEGQYTVPVWWAACGETTLRKRLLLTPFGRAVLKRTLKQLGAESGYHLPRGYLASSFLVSLSK